MQEFGPVEKGAKAERSLTREGWEVQRDGMKLSA